MSQEQATCLPLRERCDMARIGFFGKGRIYEAYYVTIFMEKWTCQRFL